MSIQVTVIDPKNTDPADIKNVIRFLASSVALTVSFSDVNGAIHPDDNPAAGRDAGNGQVAPSIAGAATPMIAHAGMTPTLPGSAAMPSGSLPLAPSLAPPGLPAVPQTPGLAPVVEKDSAGYPHDNRIHSSSKTKNADGQWKKRKGVDDATVAQVQGELRQLMAATVPAAFAPAVVPTMPGAGMSLPVETAPMLPPGMAFGAPGAGVVPNGGMPAAPPNLALSAAVPAVPVGASPTIAPPAMPPMTDPVPPGVPTVITFPLLMSKINSSLMAGHITEAHVHQVMIHFGMPTQPAMLAQRLDLVPHVAQALFGTTAP